jgi:hypothetical protein
MGMDFRSRKINLQVVKIISNLRIYQESLMYQYLNETYDQVDTVQVRSSVDGEQYKVMYHVTSRGNGEDIVQNGQLADVIGYYMFQTQDAHNNLFVASKENFPNGIDLSQLTPNSNDYLQPILQKMSKGGSVVIAMPYIIFNGRDPVRNEYSQDVVPINSVVLLNITLR